MPSTKTSKNGNGRAGLTIKELPLDGRPREKLKALGVKAVFGPETPLQEVVACVRALVVEPTQFEGLQGEVSP